MFKKRYAVEGLLEDGTYHVTDNRYRTRKQAQRVADEIQNSFPYRKPRVVDVTRDLETTDDSS